MTSILKSLVQRSAIESPKAAASIVIRFIRQQESLDELSDGTTELLEAWIAGCKRGRHGVSGGMDSLADSSKAVMQRAFQSAATRAVDKSADPADRARCIRLALETKTAPADLKVLFSDQTPRAVKAVVLEPLLRSDPVWMHEHLKNQISGMSIELRSVALAACSRRASDASWLMGEISSGSIPKTMIDPELAKRLRQHPDAKVSRMAEELLRADPDRAKVLARYSQSVEELGDPVIGKRLFAEQCAACHRIDGQGTNVGPDISDTRTKSADSLLMSIIDPNAAIDSAFVQFRVLSVDGRVFEGLLVDETAEAVTLQQKGGERVVVRRDDVERMQTSGASLMPEGFERTLNPKAMSDLVSYLKNWRYLKTEIPGTLRD